MNKIGKCIASALFLAGCLTVNAHDFTATVNGQKLFFNIKSESDKTIEVTYNGSIADKKYSEATGNIEIPARVKHNDVIYTVVSVGAKAFSHAEKLEGVTLPSTIKAIGDFAFEGCTSLSRIIFPGGMVSFGEGVFFKCTAIKDISLGSDWKTADVSRFRWSDSLETIAIPAKVEKIQGLKKLKNLKSVTVDVNNSRFSAVGGVLYSKDRKTLYGCPRAYSGALKIPEGTEVISRNALTDCSRITQIDFPETLGSLSFRETSRMTQLETVIFRGKTPLVTAYFQGKEVFLLQVANKNVTIVVPNEAKKAIKAAFANQEGEYAEAKEANSTPYVVKYDQMPKESNIIGVKNFSKYE